MNSDSLLSLFMESVIKSMRCDTQNNTNHPCWENYIDTGVTDFHLKALL